jgi:hypothetical protein
VRTALVASGLTATLAFALTSARQLDQRSGPLPATATPRRAGWRPPVRELGGARPADWTLPPMPTLQAVPEGPRPPRGTYLALVYGGNGQGEIEPCG